MSKLFHRLLLGVALLLPSNAVSDQLVAVGIYCVSVESYAEPLRTPRSGERQPQISFRVSNRSETEDEIKIFAVAPLNDNVFRRLAALAKGARICLSANRLAIRHGLDILLAWDLKTCEDFDCTNLPKYEKHVQGHPLRHEVRSKPATPKSEPSNQGTAGPESDSSE